MPNKDKNIPKRRFKEFENADAWELRKLGEVAISFDYGLNSAATEYDGENKYLRITDIDDDSREFNISDLTSPEINLFGLDEYRLSIGDILFARTGASVGKSYIYRSVDGKVYFAGFLIRVKIKDTFNPDFVFQNTLTSNYERFISITSMRSGQPGVNAQEYSNYEIMFPSLPEQEVISTFFSTLDQQITLHQRKLDMLKEQKKTCLKLLFPAKGQTKPVLRFQGFEDDWEKVKLGEIGETFTGLSGKTKEDFGHGEGKFITYVNVFNNPISDLLGTDRIEVDESQTNVQFGDIFFTTSSETPEEVGMSSVWLGNGNNIYLNSFCFGFRPTLKLSNHFMAYVLRSTEIRKKFIFLAQGISRYNISKTKVMNISIPLPTLPEQESIGTFFQTLDQEIAQVEDKLASLKEMKKTLLRKLFV